MLIVHHGPRARPRPLALLALAGFTASLLVHSLSYAGIAAQLSIPAVWGLHAGIFVVFIPFVLALRRWRDGRRLRWQALLPYFPTWARLVVPAVFVYVMATFFWAMGRLPFKGESARRYEARVGSVTAAAGPAYEARAFSGHWLFFYLLSGLFLLYVPPGARPTDEGAADAEATGRRAAD